MLLFSVVTWDCVMFPRLIKAMSRGNIFRPIPILVRLFNQPFCFHRYANPGDAIAGHITHVGKCFTAMFLRILHIRHCGSPTLGRNSETTLRICPSTECNTTQVCFITFKLFLPRCSMRPVLTPVSYC